MVQALATIMAASPVLHAGPAHLVTNVFALGMFGPRVVRALGWWKFSSLFLLAGILANLASTALMARPVIGASGAIAGVMTAHLVLFPRSRLAPLIGLWIALQVVFCSVALDFGGVAWPAHVLGAVIGAGFVFLVRSASSLLLRLRQFRCATRNSIAP